MDFSLPESDEFYLYLAFILSMPLEDAKEMECINFMIDKVSKTGQDLAFCTDGTYFIVIEPFHSLLRWIEKFDTQKLDPLSRAAYELQRGVQMSKYFNNVFIDDEGGHGDDAYVCFIDSEGTLHEVKDKNKRYSRYLKSNIKKFNDHITSEKLEVRRVFIADDL